MLGPTYEEHEHCWARHGHDVASSRPRSRSGPTSSSSSTRTIPPAGSCRRQLLRQHRGLLIVDEAFVDLLPPSASLAGDLPANTIVLRSFGKVYGLAGVRLGFAIAEKPIADRIRDELGPWAVSGPALEIGRRALADSAWLQAATVRLAADRQRLDTLLVAAGCEILGGTPLFRLARHPDAAGLADRLGRQGIHVRRFAHEPQWLRFGLPANASEFGRVEAALA